MFSILSVMFNALIVNDLINYSTNHDRSKKESRIRFYEIITYKLQYPLSLMKLILTVFSSLT